MSCAKIGSSAVADAKNVAKKSSSIVERIIGERKTKRRPSRAALIDISSPAWPLPRSVFGTLRIIDSATTTTRNEIALKTYAHPTLVSAMSTPPSAGPPTCATCTITVLRLMALARSSRGTSIGTSAWRAGASNAPAAAPIAAST